MARRTRHMGPEYTKEYDEWNNMSPELQNATKIYNKERFSGNPTRNSIYTGIIIGSSLIASVAAYYNGFSIPGVVGSYLAVRVASDFALQKFEEKYVERKYNTAVAKDSEATLEMLSKDNSMKLIPFNVKDFNRVNKSDFSNSVTLFNSRNGNDMRLEFDGSATTIICMHNPLKDTYTLAMDKTIGGISLQCYVGGNWEEVASVRMRDKDSDNKIKEMVSAFKKCDYERVVSEHFKNLENNKEIQNKVVKEVKTVDLSISDKKEKKIENVRV